MKEKVVEESQDEEEGVERDFSQIPKTNQHKIHRSSPPQKSKFCIHLIHPDQLSISAKSSANFKNLQFLA